MKEERKAIQHGARGERGAPRPGFKTRVASRLLFVLFVLFVANSALSQIHEAWTATYNNGIINGTNQAIKMMLDANGNVYVTGFSQIANGQLGYATIKYAPGGTQIWAARYDPTNYTSALPTAIALDRSNDTVVTGTATTVKYDLNGSQLWVLPYTN